MIRAEEALEQLRSANPLPDTEHVDPDELALFLAHFEERRSSMTTTDVRDRARHGISGPRRNWRPLLVFGAALVLVLALVGGIALLVGGEDEPDVATTVTTTTEVPTTTAASTTTEPPTPTTEVPTTTVTTETPAPAVLEFEWTRIDLGPGEPHPGTGTYGDPGWVTFIEASPTPGFDGASIPMFSADGLTWEEASRDPEVFEEGRCMGEAVYIGGRYVAPVGSCIGEPLEGDRLVVSVDGRTWTLAPLDPAFADGDLTPDHWVLGAPGHVALSHNSFSDGESEWGYHIVAWHSPDGETWTRLPYDETVFGGTFGWIDVRGLVYGDAGYVAVGVTDSPDGQDGVVWHSPDGITWTRIPNVGDMFGGPAGPATWIEMEATVYGNGSYVITSGSHIWTSSNGIDWQHIPFDDPADEATGYSGVAYGDGTFLLVGAVLEERPWGDGSGNTYFSSDFAAAWTSPDGVIWTRVPHDEATFGGPGDSWMSDVAYGDGVFVVAGGESRPDPDEPDADVEHGITWLAQ